MKSAFALLVMACPVVAEPWIDYGLLLDQNADRVVVGTDAFGRDLLVRLWTGARVSLGVGVTGSALSGVLGVALGALAVLDRIEPTHP